MNYYYECEGQPKGPVSEVVLRQLHADGAVNDATLVVGEGEPAWVPFSTRMVKPVEEPPTTGLAKSNKQPISAAAVDIASRAVSIKGEFDALETVRFPETTGRQGGFLSVPDLSMPICWRYFYRLHSSGKLFSAQLYVVTLNYSSQGIVHYNTAKTAGGNTLEIKNINVERDGDAWEEHLVISISAQTLASAGLSPLRIQVSRPEKGASFVIEVPVDVSLAVSYRLNPDRFEIMEESPAEKNGASTDSLQSPSGVVLGGILVFFGLWIFGGLAVALIFGFIWAYYVWDIAKKGAGRVPAKTGEQVNEAAPKNS